jgi:putative acetyltransferase
MTHEAITIRRYQPSDADAVIAIWEAANALAHPFLSRDFVDTVRADMRAVYLPNAETWIAERDGRPVGFIAMIGTEIGGLFLDPRYHGKGFGRAMVDTVVAAKGSLQVEVFANNRIGRAFYDCYGFVPIDEYVHEQSGQVTIRMGMPEARGAQQ